ncbi:MAG: hypothetical protein PVH38_12165 [Gammaproteobacteria bacterium]|jgi:hypothetical protein
MIILKAVRRAFIILLSMSCLIIPGAATAAMPDEIPPILQNLSDQLQELSDKVENVSDRLDAQEALIRRLHGNKAAVISASIDRTISGNVIAVQPHLTHCIGQGDILDDSEGGGGAYCFDAFDSDYVLTSPDIFRQDDDHAFVTFTPETAPSFADIVNLLTDGVNDRRGVAITYIKSNDTTTSPITTSSERGAFSSSQVSSQIGYVDLEGFEIGTITIAVDYINFMYNSTDDETSVNIRYRIVYELSD